MTRILKHRYFVCSHNRACDLVTGEYVRIADLSGPEPSDEVPLAPLVEVLDHGCEGDPRWLVAEVQNAAQAARLKRRAALDARRRGFVAVSVENYLRFRTHLRDDLKERALLLIAECAGSLDAARFALADASALSSRPHLLLTIDRARRAGRWASQPTGRLTLPTCLTRPIRPDSVREARAAYNIDARPRGPDRLTPEIQRLLDRERVAAQLSSSGRHAAAERVLRDVAAALERRNAPLLSGRTLVRLGRLLVERGRADAANLTFERAAELTPDADAVAESRIWQAAARADAGRLSEAESISRALLLTAAAPLRQPWIVATLARVLLWQGRVEEACSLHIDRITTNLDDEVTRVWVDSVAVKALLAGGRVFDAGQRAAAAITSSGASTNPLAQLIALTARLRVLVAAGELTVAEATLRQVLTLARQAHTPLRGVRARVLWLHALHQAGRTHDAQRELTALRRLQMACPPLLQHGIDKALEGGERSLPRNSRQQDDRLTSMAVGLIRIAQDEETDMTAVRRLMGQVATDLHTSRAELLSSDAGPVSTILSIGAGLPTHIGPRVLTAGLTLGPETFDGGTEIGVPIRLGPRLVGALVCRWAADRSPPHYAVDAIELTAAVAASRVDAMRLSARESAERATSIPELVGVSAGISELRTTIARAATAPFAVLIEGESGVGKELVARAIHQLGPRRERRFCDLNCAALPDDLLESELFGYARGAFTGAVTDRSGLFEDANGGTLFLDELADLSPRAQAKLLRALQQQEVRRLGETFSRKVDVRVITATNREMRRESLEGRFRQDLLYRLDVIRIRIPPLRDRPEDIPTLARHFWSAAAGRVASAATLSHETLCALAHYPWPGNARELQNVLAALAVAAPARGLIRPGLLPPAIVGAARITSGRLADAREQFERRFVEAALARAGGSRTRAAGELGLSRQGLLKLMSRLEIAGDKPITSAAHG